MNDPAGSARRTGPVVLWTRRALTALISAVMFAMMALTTADVAGRAIFNMPVKGGFEIITFLLAILVFASFPLITWDEKHITVSLFERWIGGTFERVLGSVVAAVSTFVVAMITYRMWIQGDLMAEGQHITGFLEWPIAPIAYAMAALSGLTTVILATITWQKLTGRAGAPPNDGEASGRTGNV